MRSRLLKYIAGLAAILLPLVDSSMSLAKDAAPVPSEEVRALQRQLREFGYIDTPDTGLLDMPTRYQIWFFADEHGIDKDGLFDNLQPAGIAEMLRQRTAEAAERAKKAQVVVLRNHSQSSTPKVAISPDGKWAVSFDDELVKLWNLDTGLAVRDLEFGCCTGAATFLPDSRYLAIGTSGPSIRLLDLATGKMTHRLVIEGQIGTLDRHIKQLKVRPNSTEIVVGDRVGQISIYDWQKNAEVAKLGRHRAADNMFSDTVEALDVSPDGKLAASFRDDDTSLVIWDLAARKQLKTIKIPKSTSDIKLAFGADSAKLFVWSTFKNSMSEVDVKSGQLKSVPLQGILGGLFVHPASMKASAVISDAKGQQQVGALDLSTRAFEPSYPMSATGFESSIGDFVVDPGTGRAIISDYNGLARVGNLRVKESWAGSANPQRIAQVVPCGPDQSVIQFNSYSVRVGQWDMATGIFRRFIRTDGKPRLQDNEDSDFSLKAATCDAAGERLIAGLSNGNVSLWSLTGETPQHRSTMVAPASEAYDKVLGLALSPDERLVAVSRGNGMVEPKGSPGTERKNRSEIVMFDVGLGTMQRVIPFDKLTSEETWGQQTGVVAMSSRHNAGELAFSRDGARLFAARQEWRFGMWDADSGRRLHTYETLQKFQRFLPNVGVKTAEDRRVAVRAERGFSRVQSIFAPAETSNLYALLGASDMGFSPRKAFLLAFSYGFSHPERVIEVESATIGAMDRKGTRFYMTNGRAEILAYDVASGELLRRVKTTQGGIATLSVSNDGSRLYTATAEGALQTWDSETGELLTTSVLLQDGEWLTMTPEGFFGGSPKAGQLVQLRLGPMEISTIDQVYQYLYRPDLVREKLAGDPRGLVKEAAAKLDLGKMIASGAAPKVGILPLASGGRAESETISVEAELTDRGGGVGRVEWRVNGVTQGDIEGQRGLARVEGEEAPSRKLRQALALEVGENIIELVAYNAANLIASEPAKITVTLAEDAIKTRPKLYILAVGINDYYDGRLRLTYAVPDATKLVEGLQKAGAGHYDSIEVTTLTDAQVTAAGLDAAFEDLSKKVRPRDVLVFFAAGHGKTVDGRYYYLPRDFRYQTAASISEAGIGQDKWQTWFAKVPARKSILIYDTCESGTLTAPGEHQVAALMRSGLEQQAAIGRLNQATGRTVLTAATSDRPALEGYRGHGVFTYALLDGLAKADRDGNGLIEVTELAGYVDATVPEITEQTFGLRQLPQMSLQGSDFALARKVDGLLGEVPAETAATQLPTQPTHFAFEPAKVFKEPGGANPADIELEPGTTFAIIKTENGWAAIARAGKMIGYVESGKTRPLN